MSTPFNPTDPLIVVSATIEGPAGTRRLHLAVDTASDGTIIAPLFLRIVGIDPDAGRTVRLTTASGTTTMTLVAVDKLSALGKTATNFLVSAHAFPPGIGIDGVLGLDFMRGHVLKIDFQAGQIDLT